MGGMNYVLYRSGAIPTGGKNSYKLQGIFLIRSQNVLDFQFSHNDSPFIDEEQAYDLRNVTLEKDDTLLNRTGTTAWQEIVKLLLARVN